jgi:hypothetical protein
VTRHRCPEDAPGSAASCACRTMHYEFCRCPFPADAFWHGEDLMSTPCPMQIRSAGAPDGCAKAPLASCGTIIVCSIAIRSGAAHPTRFPTADGPVIHQAVSLAAMMFLQHLAQMPLAHQLVQVPLPCCGMHGLLTALLDEQLQ